MAYQAAQYMIFPGHCRRQSIIFFPGLVGIRERCRSCPVRGISSTFYLTRFPICLGTDTCKRECPGWRSSFCEDHQRLSVSVAPYPSFSTSWILSSSKASSQLRPPRQVLFARWPRFHHENDIRGHKVLNINLDLFIEYILASYFKIFEPFVFVCNSDLSVFINLLLTYYLLRMFMNIFSHFICLSSFFSATVNCWLTEVFCLRPHHRAEPPKLHSA